MLAGTVYFYDDFKRVLLEMDIEDLDALSDKALFEKILELGASKVVVQGLSNNHQDEPSESVIFSRRY